jgi:hypothetical protein
MSEDIGIAEHVSELDEVATAASRAVAQHLSAYVDSTAAEDLWANNPELSEQQATDANYFGLGILIGIGTAAAQDQPSWPQVCRAVQPEDLDR